jgi:hypothetical protein
MAFIYSSSDSPEYGEMASLLVAMAREAGIHPRELQAVPYGFLVPDAISDQLSPVPVSMDPRDEGKVPPAGWDEPLAPADVEFGEDGKVYLTPEAATALEPVEVIYGNLDLTATVIGSGEPEVPAAKPDSSIIRSWARENGHKVPERGRVPQSVIDAFYEAHPGE